MEYDESKQRFVVDEEKGDYVTIEYILSVLTKEVKEGRLDISVLEQAKKDDLIRQGWTFRKVQVMDWGQVDIPPDAREVKIFVEEAHDQFVANNEIQLGAKYYYYYVTWLEKVIV